MKFASSLEVVLLLILTIILAACGTGASAAPGQPAVAGDPAAGETLFMSTCSACHGPDGQGLPGLGKNLVTGEFMTHSTDKELVEFIKVGRTWDDPLNTTGIAMPPKGGNPALSDTDLANIVAYIRQLQGVR